MNSSVSFAAKSGTTSVRNDDDHPDAPSGTTASKDKSRSKRNSKKKKTASSRSSRCMPSKQPKITVGCRGDPRMNEAVFLRLANPKLSMTDALLRGGFTFGTQTLPPPPGVLDRNVLDDDGVSLQQRKNQLMRRLRKDRDRKQKAKEAKQKQKGGGTTAVQEDAEQTAASGGDKDYYSRINNRRRRKTRPSAEEDGDGGGDADGSYWKYPATAAAALNDDGSSTASAADGSVGHVVLGGPTILDRLTALEQVQSALRMNAEMQRQILEEQQQQQQQRQAPTQQDHVDNDDQSKNVVADDDDNAHNKRPGHGRRENPSQGEATRQEVQELQNNLQRLIEDVLVTESDRHDQDMLQDHLPDSAAAATLTATAAAAQHMHASANTSRGSTPSLNTCNATRVPLVVHPVPMAVQQPLIAALPTLFGPAAVGGGTAINLHPVPVQVPGPLQTFHALPTLFKTDTGGGGGGGSAGIGIPNFLGTVNVGANALAPPVPAAPAPTLPATITLTGEQYLDQSMLQQQMTAFQRQQVTAFAELAAAAAAASSRQDNTL